MGCLNINTSIKTFNSKLSTGLLNNVNCNSKLLNVLINSIVNLLNKFYIKCTPYISNISIKAKSKNGLSLRANLVCTLDEFKKLEVSPDSVYLFKGNDFTDYVIIKSNINWNIR